MKARVGVVDDEAIDEAANGASADRAREGNDRRGGSYPLTVDGESWLTRYSVAFSRPSGRE